MNITSNGQQELPIEDNNKTIKGEGFPEPKVAEEEVKWVNKSENPLCLMWCWPEDNVLLLEKHKSNFELMIYDYYQKFLGYPMWSAKATVVPVEELKMASMSLYNNYIKACKKLQEENEDQTLYAIDVEFDIDTGY